MNKEEIKQYLIDNLNISVNVNSSWYECPANIEINLILENEVISSDSFSISE